jgi:hypothetical protein
MRNARKAAIGYATWAVGKQALRIAVRRKARQMAARATPTEPRRRRRKPFVGAAAAAAITAAGVVAMRKLRANGAAGDSDTP